MNRRSHPVRLLMDHLAIGGELTADDLADLRFADEVDRAAVERRIRAAGARIAAERREGRRGIARQTAIDAANEIIAATGDTMPSRDDNPTDPRALAEMIAPR